MLRVSPVLRTPSLASELAVPAAGGLTAQTSSACFSRAPLLPSVRRVPRHSRNAALREGSAVSEGPQSTLYFAECSSFHTCTFHLYHRSGGLSREFIAGTRKILPARTGTNPAKHQLRCAPMDAGIISSRAENHGLSGPWHGAERSTPVEKAPRVPGWTVGSYRPQTYMHTSEGMRPGRTPQMDVSEHAVVH
jgi:hypothetical protein